MGNKRTTTSYPVKAVDIFALTSFPLMLFGNLKRDVALLIGIRFCSVDNWRSSVPWRCYRYYRPSIESRTSDHKFHPCHKAVDEYVRVSLTDLQRNGGNEEERSWK